MFVAYHLAIFIPIWIFLPEFNSPWVKWLDWFRVFLNTIIPTIFFMSLAGSMLSCFTSKKLKKTQIGQWSVFEWMPCWGKNERNSWYGLFTGLPSYMVNIQAFDGVVKTEKKVQQIQTEKYGDPKKGKFAAEFDFNFTWIIVDTWLYINNPNKLEDLMNIVVKSLTEWLNDPGHNYEDVVQLKKDISSIQTWVDESIIESIYRYGVLMSNFKLVDIEQPKSQIEQQIKDAAAARAQGEQDLREKMDTDAFIAQVQDLVDKSPKDAAGNPTLSFKDAMNTILTLRGIVKRTDINSGGGKKNKAIPVVHT